MTRSLMAGGTIYSGQSLTDLMADLRDWGVGLHSDRDDLVSTRDTLQAAGQWDSIDWDFREVVEAAIVLFETCESEIELVLKDLPDTVRSDHVTSLKALARRTEELNERFGQVWHRDGFNKSYGDPWFRAVEELYVTGRERAADLLDLASLAERLADFLGRAGVPWFQRPLGKLALTVVGGVIAGVVAGVILYSLFR